MKSERWSELKKKLPSSEHQEDIIQRLNHGPFILTTLYDKSKVKLEMTLGEKAWTQIGSPI